MPVTELAVTCPDRVLLEREARLTPPAGWVMPDLRRAGSGLAIGPATVQRRDTLYVDTPDFALADRGITVRRDRTGDTWDWQLVVTEEPGDPFPIRRHMHFAGTPAAAPAALTHYLATHHRRRGLVPVARVSGGATGLALLDGAGIRMATVVDEESHVLGTAQPSTLRQVSVTTLVLNDVGGKVLRSVTDLLVASGCRLDLAAGDVLRFAGDVAGTA